MGKRKTTVAALLLSLLYRALGGTWRIRHIGLPKSASPQVFAHWHGDELLLVGAYRNQNMTVMTSRSKDGELMKQLLTRLGYGVVRGSSSRGGAAGLKGLIDAVRLNGSNASLAVDGPRGPRFKVKPGIIKLAQQTGAVLVPGAAAASTRFVFKKAWNQCYLPLPFARCVIVYGDPISVPTTLSSTEEVALLARLEKELGHLRDQAEARVGRQPHRIGRQAIDVGV